MNCIIVDDEKMSRMQLEHLAAKIEDLNVIGVCENASSAIKLLGEKEVDLMILDIEMPDISGMDMVKAMSDLPHIIITSSKENYALEAFEYDIIDYIKKPVTLPRLLKAIDKVAKSSTSMKKGNEGEVFVKVDSRFIKLKIQDIFFLESMGDYVVFHTENEKHTVHTTLKNIEEKLPADLFLKVHRSFVVNLKKIVDIEDNSLVINDKVIPISRTHKPQLFKKINIL